MEVEVSLIMIFLYLWRERLIDVLLCYFFWVILLFWIVEIVWGCFFLFLKVGRYFVLFVFLERCLVFNRFLEYLLVNKLLLIYNEVLKL